MISRIRTRLHTVNQNIVRRGLQYVNGYEGMILISYSYQEVYDWDLYFENIYMSYYGISKYCFNNYDVFFKRQQPNGFIPRSFGPRNWGKQQHFKPFIAQNIVLGLKQQENTAWLEENYTRLKAYLEHWFSYDTDKNGLCYWPYGADHSGCDNQSSRCRGKSEGVDLNCYLVRECRAMALLADKQGNLKDKAYYENKAQELARLINEYLWDPESGFYYDRNEEDGETTYVKAVSGFTPLWAGIASADQAKRLVEEHLLNENEFWTTYPIATYAQTECDYYVGVEGDECNWRGNTWIPTNYMIFQGLRRYNYDNEAKELAARTCDLALNQNPTTREFYNSETGEGLGLNPFWGWSSLAYVMPIEFDLDYDPSSLNAKNITPILKKHLDMDFFLNEKVQQEHEPDCS